MGIAWLFNKRGIENESSSITDTNGNAGINEKMSGTSEESMSKYKISRSLAKAVTFIGWGVVVLSVYGLLHLGLTMMSLYLIVGSFVSGFLLVIAGQFTRATIDTADNTSQILALMKSKDDSAVQ